MRKLIAALAVLTVLAAWLTGSFGGGCALGPGGATCSFQLSVPVLKGPALTSNADCTIREGESCA
jgi:hypothetical protein